MSELVGSLPELIRMPNGLDYVVASIHGEKRLFCPETGEYYRKGRFNKKQKRHFSRLRSGFELAFKCRERITFLTLSTQYDIIKDSLGMPILDIRGKSIAVNKKEMILKRQKINKAFTKLKQAIERIIQRIMYCRYCHRHKIPDYRYLGKKHRKTIANKKIFDKFKYKLKYFKLKTSEGGGVLHIVFRKGWGVPMIPFEWLKKKWYHLWGAKSGVNIKSIDITDVHQLSMYMVGQYFAKQPVIRMSCGYFWIGQHVKERMQKLIVDHGYNKAIARWKLMYQSNLVPLGVMGYQKRLRWKKLPSTYFRLYLCNELVKRQKLKITKTMQTIFWVDGLGLLAMGTPEQSFYS